MNPINEVQDIWAYLRTTPLLWLMLTMMAYLAGFWCFEKVKRSPIVSPVAIAASFLGVILLITDTPYPVYFEGAQFCSFSSWTSDSFSSHSTGGKFSESPESSDSDASSTDC